MKKHIRTLCLAVTIMSAQGCVTSGSNFPSRIDWIKQEKTHKRDVELILGKPYTIGNSGGTPTWTYSFYEYRLFGKNSFKELKIYWNADDTVKQFSFNSTFASEAL